MIASDRIFRFSYDTFRGRLSHLQFASLPLSRKAVCNAASACRAQVWHLAVGLRALASGALLLVGSVPALGPTSEDTCICAKVRKDLLEARKDFVETRKDLGSKVMI